MALIIRLVITVAIAMALTSCGSSTELNAARDTVSSTAVAVTSGQTALIRTKSQAEDVANYVAASIANPAQAPHLDDVAAKVDAAFADLIQQLKDFDPQVSDSDAKQAFDDARERLISDLEALLANLKGALANAWSLMNGIPTQLPSTQPVQLPQAPQVFALPAGVTF